jgi:sn-glycerol 3-phosphate transport system ATP-binding protein
MFAARFIGTPPMNLVALADGARGAVIRGAPETAVFAGRGTGRVLGVRPEHIALVSSGGVPARVSSTEYHGADTVLTVQAGEESLLVRAPGRVQLADGAAVRLGWKADAMHLFDVHSGARVALDQSVPQPA